jgi:hypothetical protein
MERENLIDDDAADKRMKVKTTVLKQTFHYMFLHSSQTKVPMLEQYLPSTQSEIFKMGAEHSKTFHFISFQNV